MNNIWSWFSSTQEKQCSEHKNKFITKVCCSDFCRLDRYLCDSQQCQINHRGHHTIDYKYFKELHRRVQREMDFRQKIQQDIREYYEFFIKYLQELFGKEIQKLIDAIDRKFYSKQFIELYQRSLRNKDYIPLLEKVQTNIGQSLRETIKKKITEKQKKIPNTFKQFLDAQKIVLDQAIFPQTEKIQQIIAPSKSDKLKAFLPFKCEVYLKFQASKNKFLTNNIYQLGIRGPIVVLVQSYKNRLFGGYSPKMFPKQERYEEDTKCESFIFSIDENMRLPLKESYRKYAIKGGPNLWFGRGDLVIADECHKGNISWAELGRAYQAPSQFSGKLEEWLGGAWYFRILQYEIYEVQKIEK